MMKQVRANLGIPIAESTWAALQLKQDAKTYPFQNRLCRAESGPEGP
jgi:hypothetical protein